MPAKQKITAITGLLSGAAVWGMVWYPFRVLEEAAISGMLSSFLVYAIALVAGLAVSGPVWRELRTAGWWAVLLLFSAGWTNFGYVAAIIEGEVMRVLLLFFLSPLWTVLFSRVLLGEKLNRVGVGVMALSLGGAVVMLWRPDGEWPLPTNRAEWLALSAGVAFALSNVISRHLAGVADGARSVSIWLGVLLLTLAGLVAVPGDLGFVAGAGGSVWLLLVGVGLAIGSVTYAVQYGLARVPANQAIVIFLFELVVAAVASYFLAHEHMDRQEWVGALMIVTASLFSGHMEDAQRKETADA